MNDTMHQHLAIPAITSEVGDHLRCPDASDQLGAIKNHPHCSSSSFTVSDGHLKRRSEAIVELVN